MQKEKDKAVMWKKQKTTRRAMPNQRVRVTHILLNRTFYLHLQKEDFQPCRGPELNMQRQRLSYVLLWDPVRNSVRCLLLRKQCWQAVQALAFGWCFGGGSSQKGPGGTPWDGGLKPLPLLFYCIPLVPTFLKEHWVPSLSWDGGRLCLIKPSWNERGRMWLFFCELLHCI